MTDEDLFGTAAGLLTQSSSLESVSRPFLDLLHQLTGLESAYLTEIRPDEDDQVILFADNRGRLQIDEGQLIPWRDTVCRRALESGVSATSDVETELPGSPIAAQLGIVSYIGVPVVGADSELLGTLCTASSDSVRIRPQLVGVMRLLAQLIGAQWVRDRNHADAIVRAETAENRLRERAVFLAQVEHQLKSPLTVIRGWSELLVQDWASLDDQQRADAARTVLDAARQASDQLDTLLTEARSEVQSLDLTWVEVDLNTLLADVGRQLEGIVSERHAVGIGPVEPAEEGVLTTDRDALWQVLWHLVENAVKYSPDGGEIRIDARVDGPEMIIEVADQGIGLPVGVDVFAAFARGPHSQVGDIAGTGLGLHIVRNLVSALAGTVTASSSRDSGACFRVTLPRQRDAGPLSAESHR